MWIDLDSDGLAVYCGSLPKRRVLMGYKNTNRSSGFTLLEIMLVISIISILAVVSYGSYQRYLARANVAELVSNIDAMREAFGLEVAENGDIAKFASAGEGKVPSELSSLEISPNMMQYSDLGMSFTFMSFRGDKERPYILLVAKDDSGTASLSALADVLPDRTFFWASEPSVAMVPMTEFNAFSGVNLPPAQGSTQNPQPVAVTTAPQPSQSATTPTSAKLYIPNQYMLDTISMLVNGGMQGMRPDAQAVLAKDVQDLQTAINSGDRDAADALSAKVMAFVNDKDFIDQVGASSAVSFSRHFADIHRDIAALGSN